MLLLCHLEGPKNQSFRNNTGIPQLIRAKFGTHRSRGDNAQEILGAIVSLGENERGGVGRAPRGDSCFVVKTRRLFGNHPTADFHRMVSF